MGNAGMLNMPATTAPPMTAPAPMTGAMPYMTNNMNAGAMPNIGIMPSGNMPGGFFRLKIPIYVKIFAKK
jgi:hypothetical protein